MKNFIQKLLAAIGTFNIMPPPPEIEIKSDEEAIRGDWQTIGNDFNQILHL